MLVWYCDDAFKFKKKNTMKIEFNDLVHESTMC